MNNRLFNLKNINESELKEFLSYINRRLKKKIILEKLTKLMEKLLQKKRSRNLGKIQIIPVTNYGNQLQEIIIEIEDEWELSKYNIAGMVKNEIKKKNNGFCLEMNTKNKLPQVRIELTTSRLLFLIQIMRLTRYLLRY